MSRRATPEERGLILAECDSCGDDLFKAYFNERLLVLRCDSCGAEVTERLVS